MIYRAGSCLLILALMVGLSVADDPAPGQPEPPVRLKKKDKPKADAPPDQKPDPPKDKDEAKDDEPADLQDPEQDPKETLARVSKNMKSSADRLADKDPGEGTRQVQRDIIKDLDSLIEQMKQQQQSNSSKNSSSSNDSSSSKKQDDKHVRGNRRERKPGSGNQKNPRNSSARGNKSGQDKQPKDGTAKGQNPGRGGNGGRDEMDKRPNSYKDVWGHLPEALRMEMDAYAREKFMAKYDDLLKQYYSTVAEKGRR
jgi:hypothetical protein